MAEKLLSLELNRFDVLTLRADAYRRLHHLTAAERDCLELIQLEPARVDGYLGFAELAERSPDRLQEAIDQLRNGLIIIADDPKLTERLATLFALRIQQRIPSLASAGDFRDILPELAELIDAGSRNPWLLACQAECLIERREAGPRKEERDQALLLVNDRDALAETGSYGRYVRGLVYYVQQRTAEAAAEIVAAFSTEKVPPILEGRCDRARGILVDASAKLRLSLASAQRDRLWLNLVIKDPYQTPEAALQAYVWLQTALRLSQTTGAELPVALRTNLMLAAWQKADADSKLARELSAALLGPPSREQLGTDLVPTLLINARVQPNDPQGWATAVARYVEMLDVIQSDKRWEAPPIELHEQLLQPALQAIDRLTESGAGDKELSRRIALVYSAKGRLVRQHRYAAWPWDPVQEAIAAYDKAIEFDDTRAEYYAGRAVARSLTGRPDLSKLEIDARLAQEKDSSLPGGHGMLGYVSLLRSRAQSDPSTRVRHLQDAIAAFSQAITLCDQQGNLDGDLGTYLTNRTTAYVELGNFDPVERRQHLDNARKDGERATDLNERYPEYAWDALGNALEDIAWMLGETEKYAKAIEAFDQAVQARDDSAKYRMDRGRCYYKRVAFGREDPRFLDDAWSDLKKATEFDPEMGEAFYWLAKTQLARSDYAEADKSFAEAVRLANQQNSSYDLAAYLRDWSVAAIYDYLDGAGRTPPDPPKVARLAVARRSAEELKPFNPLQAAYLLGRTYELERNFRNALQVYASVRLEEYFAAGVPAVVKDDAAKLLLARSNCRYASEELRKEDAQNKPIPLSIVEADQAAQLAVDRLLIAEALAIASRTRLALANEPNFAQAAEFRRRAVEDLERAIAEGAQHSRAFEWRERLARQYMIYMADPKYRDAYKQKALEQIDAALKSPHPNLQERGRLGGLRAELLRQ
jgi:hypothetical protein